MMKRLFVGILFFFTLSHAFAGNISKIVFFGDSLTDNGKLYQILLHVLPKSPPYYNGRFSNGPTWAENVAKYYYDKYYLKSQNYALGGATAIFHLPTTKFISTTTLEIEVSAYLLDSLFKNKSHVLYVIWIGANDYLYSDDVTHIEDDTNKVIKKIDWAMRTLKYYGANNYVIINLPDLSRIPFAYENDAQVRLKTASVLHNIKLQAAIDKFQEDHPQAQIISIDAFGKLNDLIDHPEIYNEKYNINITDTKTACWLGGFLMPNRIDLQKLRYDIELSYRSQRGKLPLDFDPTAASQMIISSPELAYTYALGQSYQSGNVPCSNANEHVFWDDIHPTDVIHRIFAMLIEETLGDVV